MSRRFPLLALAMVSLFLLDTAVRSHDREWSWHGWHRPSLSRTVAQATLNRPDPAVDENATGSVKLKEYKDRSTISVEVHHLARESVFTVKITKGETTEEMGKITIPAARVHHPRCYKATLDGAQEVPAVETEAEGAGKFVLMRSDRSKLKYQVVLEGLSGPVTGAHIHLGAVGEEGDVVYPLISEENPPKTEDGKTTIGGSLAVTEADRANLEAGKFYVNIHTEKNPEGEIRGQLIPCVVIEPDLEGSGALKIDTAKGDKLPLGAASVLDLVGAVVSVSNAEDKVVLSGTIEKKETPAPPAPRPRCFSADLSGAEEVPAVETEGTGKAVFVRFSFHKSQGLFYKVTVDKLSGPVTAAHIHAGDPGVKGDVVYPLDEKRLCGFLKITDADIENLAAGKYYVNVHTEKNADGEIRGQIKTCTKKPANDDDDDGDDGDNGDGGDPASNASLGDVAASGDDDELFDDFFFDMEESHDASFRRGDVNLDGNVNVSDPIGTLGYLFQGGPAPDCEDAADANDDGRIDLTDPIAVLMSLFGGEGPLPEPGRSGALGFDPTADELFCSES